MNYQKKTEKERFVLRFPSLPKDHQFKKRKVYFGSWFQRFEFISTGPIAFGPVASAIYHGEHKYWGEQPTLW